jgi:hypothetical protein
VSNRAKVEEFFRRLHELEEELEVELEHLRLDSHGVFLLRDVKSQKHIPYGEIHREQEED